ncbi:MAG: phosphatidate cytidylyltransferase [Actinomycetaceae bacterium]|nr:phosphatidate cytidylyltransferase [Actinomycetaceae bacterium]MDY5854845.1 phosphatidate cytidylyltransferase [Arcanobacterium sp.]
MGVNSFLAAVAPHPPKSPHEQHSKSGRDMPAAVVTALVLVAIVAVSVAFHPIWFVVLAVVGFAIGLWEAAGAFIVRDIHAPVTPMILGVLLMAIATYSEGIAAGFLTFCFSALFVMAWAIFSRRQPAVMNALAGVFALGWIGMSGMFAVAMTALPNAAWCIVTLVLLPAASDTGGLALGVVLGKHPIAPSISPKKSWEGFAGSVLFSFIAAWLFIRLALGLNWWWVLTFTLITPVLATVGDFAESLLKRDMKIKDMGTIFPGHGGMLDRIDAVLFCAPSFYLLYLLALGAPAAVS